MKLRADRKIPLVLLFLFFPCCVFAQDKAPVNLSPSLQQKPAWYYSDSLSEKTFLLQVKDQQLFSGYIRQTKIKPDNIALLMPGIFQLKTSPKIFAEVINGFRDIVFADEQIKPIEEGSVSSYDFTVNRINAAHHYFPHISGRDQTVSVKENFMDTSDIDLLGRYKPSSAVSATGATHATIMTTLIAGAGNSFYTGKGVAYKSHYASSSFDTALPDTVTYYNQLQAAVQNHSYGIGVQNYYGINAGAFDVSVNRLPHLVHVFSSGNSGNITNASGPYSGVTRFANITGNLKMAKNALAIGAIDSTGNIPLLSSRGPAYDGRIKPDLVAFAEDGTSGSAALVSGATLLLQQLYKQTNTGNTGSDLIRALLINSADDIENAGPDYTAGFGNLNVYRALQTLQQKNYFNAALSSNAQTDFDLVIPANSKQVKITLVWNDAAAMPGATKALINDLDVELVGPAAAETWLPWVLNPAPHVDSLQQIAKRKKDTLNNVEQVTVDDPQAGNYIIRIRSSTLQTATQAFAVAYQVDALDSFTWLYPTGSDAVASGQRQFIRWSSFFPASATGKLEFSKDGGTNWQIVNTSVLMSDQKFNFTFPDTITTAQFRITTGNNVFISDVFAVSPPLNLKVGFVCDSVLLYWNKPYNHSLFQLYLLNGDSLQPVLQTGNNEIILSPGAGKPYYAVSPVISGKNTLKSYALNYNTQGAGCYIKSFLADLVNNNEGSIKLELGSLYNVRKIAIQKWGNAFSDVLVQSPVTLSLFEYKDLLLQQGLNRYRAVVELQNGSLLYSDIETIYYSNSKPYIVFPNPVALGQPLQLLVQDVIGNAEAVIYSAQGKLLGVFVINDRVLSIPTYRLGTGLFFLVISERDGTKRKYPFTVQ